jgi:hypothetical protein
MDTHPDRTDDMNDLQRRLSAWQPAALGLDADAMLFAAGRASVIRGPSRFMWPALVGLLSVLVVFLGAWLAVERDTRISLARQLRRQMPVTSPSLAPTPTVPAESVTDDADSPDSFLTARRAYDQGLDAWPPEPEARAGSAQALPNGPILQVGHRDMLLDP